MEQQKSKFKKSGPYGILIFLNVSFAILIVTFLIWIESRTPSNQFMDQSTLLITFLSAMLIQFILVFFFFSQCKTILIREDEIRFANPVFPYLSKLYFRSDFDYYFLVAEETEHSKIEAIWLIKNDYLVARISSGIYSNYEELKENLPVRSSGYKNMGMMLQAKAVLGLKVHLSQFNNITDKSPKPQ